jgi:hypothetical protein
MPDTKYPEQRNAKAIQTIGIAKSHKESLKISRNLVIAICLNHDLEKHNSKCEKRKLGKCYYVHGIKPNY